MKNYLKRNKPHYHYIITLDQPYWPRKLADELMNGTCFAPNIVSVTDVQNSSHIYGTTYRVRDADWQPSVRTGRR